MGKLILVLGGARSGKSMYAEELARELVNSSGDGQVLYVATARAEDKEMRQRIKNHQASRPSSWRTLELSQGLGPAIQEAARSVDVVLVDCWTMLIANRLLAAAGPEADPFDDPSADPFDATIEDDILAEGEALAACAREIEAQVIVVSNEVGMGLVPPYELGRAYRDFLGRANQQLGRYADDVYFLVAGLPMRVKGEGHNPLQ
jgi:adenosylcobinamide kinase/adenosylcobinamide-phosphate guanylyltransferase